jgi:acyl-coenzyme A thioesterase PaaI-like protein
MTDISDHASSVPSRLGVTGRFEDGELILDLWPTPPILHHGCFRISAVSYVIDAVAGITVDGDPDVWTFTTDMSIRMRPVPPPDPAVAVARVVRRGRRSVTCTVEVTSPDGDPVASSAIGFTTVPRRPDAPPKPSVRPEEAPELFRGLGRLDRPLREEAGIEVVDAAAGIVEVAVTRDLCNPAGTLQGAMVALIAEAGAEELVASRLGGPARVTELDLRYVGKATEGTVRTCSRLLGDTPDAPVEVQLVSEATGAVTTLAYARAIPVL